MKQASKNHIFSFLPRQHRQILKLFCILTGIVFLITIAFYSVLEFRLYMFWNIFLSALPLLLSLLFMAKKNGRAASGGLWLLWLFFFPNAPYMITDLIHISRYSFYESGIGFLPSPSAWLGLVHLTLGIACGCVFGMASLFFMQARVRQAHGKCKSWLFCGGVSLLSGAAIYVGRFMRFNSWDIFTNPGSLVKQVLQSLVQPDTWLLYMIFAAMTFLFYLPVYFLFRPAPCALAPTKAKGGSL